MMQGRILLTTFLTLVILLSCAGCTQTTPDSANFPTITENSTKNTGTFSTYILTPEDIPDNYSLIQSKEKTPDEMSQLALDMGWERGYVVRYGFTGQNSSTPTEITQSIAIYPENRISDIMSLAETQERKDTQMAYKDLPLPLTGDNTRAFQATTVDSSALTQGKINEENPVMPINAEQNTIKPEFMEILFYKGNVFEVIRMSGPERDYGVLKNISQIAYHKTG